MRLNILLTLFAGAGSLTAQQPALARGVSDQRLVANMPEFAAAFACKAGQKMVRPRACRIW